MDGISWIESWSNSFSDLLEIAVEVGAYAGLLAVVVLAINVLFRRWLTAGQMGLLWALVLVRLIVPVAPASSLSLGNLFNESAGPVADAALSKDLAANRRVADTKATQVAMNQIADGTASSASHVSNAGRNWLEVVSMSLPILWVVVGAAGFSWTIVSYVRFCRRVNRTSVCDDDRWLRLWRQSCEMAGVRRTCRILLFDGVEQPAIMGMFRPTLLMPSDFAELSDDQLRMIMLHELAHVKRGDIAMNWLLIVIRSIHWWNPVYWLAAARFRSLREQACDAYVIQRFESRPSQEYGALLLALAERRPIAAAWRVALPASILSFVSSVFRKRAVRTRLASMGKAKMKFGRWHTASIAAVIVLLVAIGFTTAREKEETPMDLPTWLASHSDAVLTPTRSYEVREVFDGPKETREYDVSECLEQIAADGLSKDVARRELDATLKILYGRPQPTDEPAGTKHEVDGSAAASKGGQGVLPTGGSSGKTKSPMPMTAMLAGSSVVDRPPMEYSINGTSLKVTAPAALHEKLRQTLDAWNKGGLAQITVETRFLSADRDLVSELGISWQFLEAFSSDRDIAFPASRQDGSPVVRAEARVDEYLPLVVSTLDKSQTDRLVAMAQGDLRTSVLMAPKVTLINGQEAQIADVVQRPFVIGVFQRPAGANEPKIVALEEGSKITVRAVRGRDRKKVHLEASLDMRSLGDVTTASTSYRGQQVSIQVPSVNRRSIDVAADIVDGQTLLVGCIPTGKQQKYAYYLMSANVIPEQE